jgi:hypothetical protein
MGKFEKYFNGDTDRAAGDAAGCGGCVACCQVMGVHALDKRQFSACQHQLYRIGEPAAGRPGGCGIYGDRPKECATYRCLWRAGCLIPLPQTRPDKLGLLFDLAPPEVAEAVGGMFVQIYECWPDSRNETKARYVLEAIAEKMPYVLIRYEKAGCEIVGPPKFKRAAARAWMGEEMFNLYEMGLLPK